MFMQLLSIAVPRDVLDIQEPEKYALLLHVLCLVLFWIAKSNNSFYSTTLYICRPYHFIGHCATAFSMQSCSESANQPYADEYH